MKRLIMVSCAVLAVSSPTDAQQPAGDALSTYLRQSFAALSRNLTAIVETMPAQDFSFRPSGVVDEVRTFGEIVLHVAVVNAFSCEMGDGKPASRMKVDSTLARDKARLLLLLSDIDDRCTAYLATLRDSALSQVITSGTTPNVLQSVRGNSIVFAIAHSNEHYGNLVTYLRANGLVPPIAAAQARFLSRVPSPDR